MAFEFDIKRQNNFNFKLFQNKQFYIELFSLFSNCHTVPIIDFLLFDIYSFCRLEYILTFIFKDEKLWVVASLSLCS